MSASSSIHSSTRETETEKRKDGEIGDQEGDKNDESEWSEHDNPLAEPSALSVEALTRYRQAQERAGVIYISRIPPGMSPTKVRHLMSAYGEVGRVYLQQEDPKRAYLRKRFTTTRKPHYTEGWVEFKDKRIARSVATMLNAQPIGGKKGSRWRDDIWTMKYLPRFKWYMLTEQVAHEQATREARLRVELSQSKMEQRHYLKQVEIGKSLEKRAEKKRKRPEDQGIEPEPVAAPASKATEQKKDFKRRRKEGDEAPSTGTGNKAGKDLQTVLGQIF